MAEAEPTISLIAHAAGVNIETVRYIQPETDTDEFTAR